MVWLMVAILVIGVVLIGMLGFDEEWVWVLRRRARREVRRRRGQR